MNLREIAGLRPFGRRLSVQRLSLCPELRLHLLGEDVDLEADCRALPEAAQPPFWAFCWGSGQALARYILDRPAELRGLRVVDFGSGCGVAAIAAALAGAADVVAVDVDFDAHRAIQANAELNDVEIRVSKDVPDDWDLLLASDVLYEVENREWLAGLAAEGRRVWLSDPERPAGPRLDWEAELRYSVQTLPDVDSPMVASAIFRLEADRTAPARPRA